MIFEIDESLNTNFDCEHLFNVINLYINNDRIDYFCDEQINIWNKINGYEVKKNGSKIFLPIPFAALNNGILVSNCINNKIEIIAEFCSSEFINMIKTACVRTELTILSKKPDYSIVNDYYYKKFEKEYPTINIEDVKKNNFNVICKIHKNQFDGSNVNIQSSTQRIKCDFTGNIDGIFIYFLNSSYYENPNDEQIIFNQKQFETISIIVNDDVILKYNYSDLLFYNSKEYLGYELPKGVYEIKLNLIELKFITNIDQFIVELDGKVVPSNYDIVIFAKSSNYLCYNDDKCKLYF